MSSGGVTEVKLLTELIGVVLQNNMVIHINMLVSGCL